MKPAKLFQRLVQQIITIPRWLYLVIVVLIGAVAQFLHLTTADVWHDEGYTMMLIPNGFIEIIERTARDVHPPLYYLVAHIWQGMFGMSEFAVRSLSILFALSTVVVIYFLVRRLFSEGTARLAALFVTFGPLLVRYSEEARMYAMATFLVILATYLIVRIATSASSSFKLWLLYALVVAAGLYTHYYTFFIIPVHIIWLAWYRGGIMSLLADWKWWTGNALAAALFAPWLPVIIAQTSRVSAGYWIPPTTIETPVNTFMQFLAFLPPQSFAGWIGGVLLTLFVIGIVHTYISYKNLRRAIGLLLLWLLLPLVIVILISIVRPVYYDRYFLYCAVALYVLLAVILTRGIWFVRRPLLQAVGVVAICLTLLGGVATVGYSATHQMGTVGRYVSDHYMGGDTIVSAELYTYFDFSYYNHTPETTKLLSEGPLSGYGETSLLYDRQDDIVVPSLDAISSDRVWVVGKAGEHDYYTTLVPDNWQLVEQLEASDSQVRLYRITAE